MRRPSVGSATTASRADYLVCPGCGCGQLQPPRGPLSRLLKYAHCECAFDNTIVETLKQIVALPEALGKHSCECGIPRCAVCPMGSSTAQSASLRCCPFPSLNLDRLLRGNRWQLSSKSRST
jgi:hypothetical protein